MDADTEEEGEAREGGNLGKDKELIRRGWDDTVDAVSGRFMGGANGRSGGPYIELLPCWT